MTISSLRWPGLFTLLVAGCSGGDGSGPNPGGANGPHSVAGAFTVAQPMVRGPIGTAGVRGHPLWDSWYSLADLGYMEEEYFISGRAKVQPDGPETDYTTRIIVRRPADPARFNGTVLLDWVNVTAQFENAVDTLEAHAFLEREGYAYVHVSAQAAGLCCTPLTPKIWDPERYAELNHPGDEFSFDMFSQIAKAIRTPAEVDPMGGLHVQTILAAGQSQSAIRLHDYVNKGYARSRVLDAILIHSDPDAGKSFAEPVPVPVLQLLSDFEALPEEPGSNENYVLWEIAGSAHQDFWVGYHQEVGQGPRVLLHAPQQPGSADADLHLVAGNYGEQLHPLHATCILAGTAFPMRYAVNAALHHLDRWARTGARPPQGPRYEFDASGMLARDGFGNALGGIRYPPVEVPAASYVSTLCGLGGITIPFTELQLQLLYPTHADYFCRMQAATRQTVLAGFLLPADAEDLMTRVEAAGNRWLTAGERDC